MKESKVVGQGTCVGYREEELAELLEGFKDVLCLKPGTTHIAAMAISTSPGPPIVQHPYSPLMSYYNPSRKSWIHCWKRAL